MPEPTADFVVVMRPTWTSPPLAVFEAIATTIETRFGPPSERHLDSNGVGLFDALCLGFACGLEVGLSRFDGATELSRFEVHANERDIAHIAFHVGVPIAGMHLWTDRDGVPLVATLRCSVIVMRTDDNGNDVEVKRLTNRCEAAALVHAYEARGHKQTYWISSSCC